MSVLRSGRWRRMGDCDKDWILGCSVVLCGPFLRLDLALQRERMREEVSKYHRHVFSPPTPPPALDHWIVCLVALSWVSGCICTTRLWLLKLSGGHSYQYTCPSLGRSAWNRGPFWSIQQYFKTSFPLWDSTNMPFLAFMFS